MFERSLALPASERRRTDDGIDVLPVDAFVEELASGRLF